VALQGARLERTLLQYAAGSINCKTVGTKQLLGPSDLKLEGNKRAVLYLLVSASGSLCERQQEVVRSGYSEVPLHVVQNSLLHGKKLLPVECLIRYGDEIAGLHNKKSATEHPE